MADGDPLPTDLALFLTKHFGEDLGGIRLIADDETGRRVLSRSEHGAAAVGDDIYLHRHLSIAPSVAEVGEVGREVARVLQHRRGDYQVAAIGALGLLLEDEADRHQQRVEATYGQSRGPVDPLGSLSITWEGREGSPRLERVVRRRLRRLLLELHPAEVVSVPRLKLHVQVPSGADERAILERVERQVRQAVQEAPRGMPRRASPPPGTLEGRRLRLQPPGQVTEQLGEEIHQGRQARHVEGEKTWKEAREGGNSYFSAFEDAQTVLDAFHAGTAVVAGRTPGRGHIVVWCGEVTGYVRRKAAHGWVDAPTHFFLFKGGINTKGSSTTSAVPVDPEFIAFDEAF